MKQKRVSWKFHEREKRDYNNLNKQEQAQKMLILIASSLKRWGGIIANSLTNIARKYKDHEDK